MSTIDQLRNYLEIDKHNLDEEFVNQPQLYGRLAEAVALANNTRDVAKDVLATVEAQLDIELRDTKGLPKPTEAAIKAAVQIHPRRQAQHQLYLDAKLEADQLNKLEEAFTQRSHSLSKLCELYMREYFSRDAYKGNEATDKFVYDQQQQKRARG